MFNYSDRGYHDWETAYKMLVRSVLGMPTRPCRNGTARSMFGATLHICETERCPLPLLNGRKMFPSGIVGEMAAFLQGPKSVYDFKSKGCNYWDQWADEDGSLRVDYGNKWIDFHGVNQLKKLVESLTKDPYGRRHLITGWDPSNLDSLSLPCCHYAYQWYVTTDGYLDMIWHQRSADLMVGVPSDVALAVLFNHLVANSTKLKPGSVTLVLGDVHIYSEHEAAAVEYLQRNHQSRVPVHIKLDTQATVFNFEPSHVEVVEYEPCDKIQFKLKS